MCASWHITGENAKRLAPVTEVTTTADRVFMFPFRTEGLRNVKWMPYHASMCCTGLLTFDRPGHNSIPEREQE